MPLELFGLKELGMKSESGVMFEPPSIVIRNARTIFAGQVVSVVCQAAYFVFVARLLGSTEYGIFVGAVAMSALLAQYSALGSHSVFLRYVSPEPGNFRTYWANVVITTAIMGSLFTALLTWAGPHLSHSATRSMIACVARENACLGRLPIRRDGYSKP